MNTCTSSIIEVTPGIIGCADVDSLISQGKLRVVHSAKLGILGLRWKCSIPTGNIDNTDLEASPTLVAYLTLRIKVFQKRKHDFFGVSPFADQNFNFDSTSLISRHQGFAKGIPLQVFIVIDASGNEVHDTEVNVFFCVND